MRPNILLILCDDLGFSDIGCYGGEIDTPNLDALAASGVRFTQMYNCARCCPSRASLLTGLYPHQAGIGHMVRDLGHPSYQGYLNDRCMTIAEVLSGAGYETRMSGKWHVGGHYSVFDHEKEYPGRRDFPRPLDRGFGRFYGTLAGAGSYFNPHSLMRDGEPIRPEGEDYYYTDAVSDAAAEMIEGSAASGKPFFLFVSYTAPHWPLHAFAEDIERYRDRYRSGWNRLRMERFERLRSAGLIERRWELSPRDEKAPPWESAPEKEWEALRMAVYAAQVDRMDQGIGRILQAVRRRGILDNTLIMFLSDNGGCAELLQEDAGYDFVLATTRRGEPVRIGNDPSVQPGPADTFMSYDLPWANVSNAPFRLYKHWVHEGGIATPFIVHWPERIRESGFTHGAAHFIDVMPTCLEAAGAQYPGDREGRPLRGLEGESLLPALQNGGWTRSAPLMWEHEGNRAVRWDRWKLVCRYPGDWELYDMRTDRTELHDLAPKDESRVARMQDMHRGWAERCGVVPWDEMLRRMKRSG